MEPEPLVRVAPDVVLEHVVEASGVFPHVALGVAGADQLQGRIKSQPIVAARLVPQDKYWNHRRLGAQGDAGQPGCGAGGQAKEIDKDVSVAVHHVLIHQNPDRTARAQVLEDAAGRVAAVESAIAAQTPVAVDEGIQTGVIERPVQVRERMAVQRVGERTELPRPHMRGQIENSFAARSRLLVVLQAVVLDHLFNALAGVPGKAGKLRQQPAHLPERAPHDATPFGLRQGGKRQVQVELRHPAPAAMKPAGEEGQRGADEPRRPPRQPTQQRKKGNYGSVFQRATPGVLRTVWRHRRQLIRPVAGRRG